MPKSKTQKPDTPPGFFASGKQKALSVLTSLPKFFRPSRVLGLLICAVCGSFYGFVDWQSHFPNGDPRLLITSQWILTIGSFAAMLGWMLSAIVTLRNSVKQHTINTLLQSRLSTAYSERLKLLHTRYSLVGGDILPAIEADFDDAKEIENLNALRYFLNHFEFIALAIRHGDLDEGLMKASMQTIIAGQMAVGEAVISRALKKNPEYFCNLLWLHKRWTSSRPPMDRVLFWALVAPVFGLACVGTMKLLESVTASLPITKITVFSAAVAPAVPAVQAVSAVPAAPAAPAPLTASVASAPLGASNIPRAPTIAPLKGP